MTKERMTIDYENDCDFEYDKNKYKTITTRIKSIEPSEGWLEPSGSVGSHKLDTRSGCVHVDETMRIEGLLLMMTQGLTCYIPQKLDVN